MLGHVESREDGFSTCRLFSVGGQIVSEDEMQLTHHGIVIILIIFEYRIDILIHFDFVSAEKAVGARST